MQARKGGEEEDERGERGEEERGGRGRTKDASVRPVEGSTMMKKNKTTKEEVWRVWYPTSSSHKVVRFD